MSLYSFNDINLIEEKWGDIMDSVEKEKLHHLEPSYTEMTDVFNIICQFIISKQRKIYGSYGLNLLLKNKNENESIYSKYEIPDIDFYSPTPIVDLIELCNILCDKNFTMVIGKDAQHLETYNVSVNCNVYCDITYVSKNIYNTIPFYKINNYIVVQPMFMNIDYMRMITDPITSYWRFGKDIKILKRYQLLQSYYPIPQTKYNISIEPNDQQTKNVMNELFNIIIQKNTLVVIGFYAYNYFLHVSELHKVNKLFNILEIPYLELISIDYKNDFFWIMTNLKNSNVDIDKITHVEYYPFFQFTDFNVDIFYEDKLICKIYGNNQKSIQYQSVPIIPFTFNILNKSQNKLQIGSFSLVLLYYMIKMIRMRTNGETNLKDLYCTVISHLVDIRNYYLNRTQKNIISNTIFKDFSVKCIGKTISSYRKRHLVIEERKKNNQKITFTYEPQENRKNPDEIPYYFSNTSGNKIINESHFIFKETVEENLIDVSNNDNQ